jgi:hypothetical protein
MSVICLGCFAISPRTGFQRVYSTFSSPYSYALVVHMLKITALSRLHSGNPTVAHGSRTATCLTPDACAWICHMTPHANLCRPNLSFPSPLGHAITRPRLVFHSPRSGRCHVLVGPTIECREYVSGEPKTWVRPHDRPGARSLVVPNPRACPCCEAVHHARQLNPRSSRFPSRLLQ